MNVFDKVKDFVEQSKPALNKALHDATELGHAVADKAAEVASDAKDLSGKYVAAGAEAAKTFKNNLNKTEDK